MSAARTAVNALGVAALTFAALTPLASAYQSTSFWIAAVGGIVLGTAIAVSGALWRWGALTVAAAVVVAYFLFGGALVLRESALFGVVPGLDTLAALALGSVRVWKQALTLEAPFAGWEQLGIAPYMLGLVVAALSVSLALRVRAFGWALAAPTALLVLAIAFSTYRGFAPGPVGAVFLIVGLAWTVWRIRLRRSEQFTDPSIDAGERPRGLRLAAVAAVPVVVVAGVAGGAAASALAGDRNVLRDHVVPPLELHDYASPLTSYREYVKGGKDKTLFTISGLPEGTRVRLATLDLYDGIVYQVSGGGGAGSGAFMRIGREIEPAVTGTPVSAEVTIGELGGVWTPTVGYLTGIRFTDGQAAEQDAALHYNSVTATTIVTTGLREADTYSFEALVPAEPTAEQLEGAKIARVTTPAPGQIPQEVTSLVDEVVGEAETPWAQVHAIENFFQTDGFFSHGLEGEAVSRSGHTIDRLDDLLGKSQMIGDDEQYAVAMALMVSQLGLPVRVVMGFVPDISAETTTVTGDDVHAWVEVPFEGHGWVAFSPTPDEDQTPVEEAPQPKQKPRVQVAQPPDTPQEPAELPPAPPVEESSSDEQPADWSWLWTTLQVAGFTLLGAMILLGPSLALIAARARRRTRRRNEGTTSDRLGGGWAEIVDTAGDVGVPVAAGATRREQAAVLTDAYPDLDARSLAVRADTAVFGVGDPTPDEVAAYWADVDSARRRVGSDAPWHRRLRAALFPGSVLRALRLPRRSRREESV